MSLTSTFSATSWLAWVLVCAGLTITSRHPLYVWLILLAVQVVTAVHGRPGRVTWHFSLLRFAAIVLTLSTLFNTLSVHVGATIIGRLPESWPLVGGILTLEAAVYGAINGLTLITLLTVFMAFNHIVPVTDLVRLTPRAFHDLGLVVLISLTYVPHTQQQLRQIQEAQAIRGYTGRGWQAWRPVALPLLIGGLERALNLSEAMVARGYGAQKSNQHALTHQLVLAAGLALLLGGWVAGLWWGWLGWLGSLMGLFLLLVLLWHKGRAVQVSHYRPRPWQMGDSWLLVASLAPAGLLAFVVSSPLSYTPYPALTWPTFDPLVGFSLLLLALPALLRRG